ncbi:MAG: hypothetical protein ACJ768_02715 [Gaiellaceae bacterium]
MDGLKFSIVIPYMRWRAAPGVLRLGERHRDIVLREARRVARGVVLPDEVATDAPARSGAAR